MTMMMMLMVQHDRPKVDAPVSVSLPVRPVQLRLCSEKRFAFLSWCAANSAVRFLLLQTVKRQPEYV
jgi:hypothetical protein